MPERGWAGMKNGELLEAAGVDSVPELAQRSPANLQKRMEEVNEQKKLTRRVPSESQVTAWVALDDADANNGCMSMVAGSHRWELVFSAEQLARRPANLL